MFTVNGKLSDGQAIRGPVNTTSYSAAAQAVESKVPTGVTLDSLKISKVSSDSGLKVAAPRKRKAADAPAAAPATPKKR